jgi:TolB-like protein
MRIRASITFTTLLIMAVIFGCAGVLKELEAAQWEINLKPSTPPDWVFGKEHPRFSQNSYLVGVGFSEKNAVSANESARSNLAKNLKVKIRSTMVDASTTEQTYVKSVIETEVDTVLEGIEIKDGWYDTIKGVYYSLAILERSLAVTIIKDRISKIESALHRNLKEGIEAETRVDLVTALSHFLTGYQKAPTRSPLINALHVITRSPENFDSQNINANEFKSRINGIVNNLNLATVSGDRQIAKTQRGVANPLIAKVYLLKEGKQIPVPNIPVIFNYETGHGELEKEKISASDGTVKTKIHKVSSYAEANHAISVKLDYSRIYSNFNGAFVEKLLAPMKNKRAVFYYAIQTPKWVANKPQAWQEGIIDLSNQLISNIPPEEKPLLGVMPFKDLRYDRVTHFSRILNEDIKTILAQSEGLILKEINNNDDQLPGEIAKANGLDYYVTGSYRLEKTGLEVRSRLIVTQTKNIQSSANILIKPKELNPEDFASIDTNAGRFESVQMKNNYQEQLEKLVAAKPDKTSFNVKTWTDKKEYEINEKIVFYVKAEKSGFLTLLDVGSSGNITVIFPNKYNRDNFIRAGVTYQIPSPNYGFDFGVQGPAGLERIKAIVTLNNIPLLKLDLDKGFHSVKKDMTGATKSIETLSKQINSVDSLSWAEGYSEIFIFKKDETYIRGSRKIQILEKPKKPIDMIGTMGNENERNE